MLAKEVKIKNIKRQREFIKDQLEHRLNHQNEDGNTAYSYVGHVLPEVIDYFKAEGYKVERITSDMLTAATKGLPVYLFTISDEVVLNDEELKAAEEVEYEDDEEEMPDMFGNLMSTLLGGGH